MALVNELRGYLWKKLRMNWSLQSKTVIVYQLRRQKLDNNCLLHMWFNENNKWLKHEFFRKCAILKSSLKEATKWRFLTLHWPVMAISSVSLSVWFISQLPSVLKLQPWTCCQPVSWYVPFSAQDLSLFQLFSSLVPLSHRLITW